MGKHSRTTSPVVPGSPSPGSLALPGVVLPARSRVLLDPPGRPRRVPSGAPFPVSGPLALASLPRSPGSPGLPCVMAAWLSLTLPGPSGGQDCLSPARQSLQCSFKLVCPVHPPLTLRPPSSSRDCDTPALAASWGICACRLMLCLTKSPVRAGVLVGGGDPVPTPPKV